MIPDEVMVIYATKNKPLKKTLREIADKTGVNIAFQDEILPIDSLVSIAVRNKPLGLVIDALIRKTGAKYKIVGNQLVIVKDEFSKAKDEITVSGYVKDEDTKERLISANVFLYDKSGGTVTNEYGFYSLTLPKGVQRVYFSYLGYKLRIKELKLTKDTTINVDLSSSAVLNEVLIVESKIVKARELPATIESVPLDQLQSFVSLGGEPDVIRLVHQLPGVSTGTDGFGGMSIRGGSIDQNLVLLDGVQIYNPNHALGVFSVFNSNVIKSAQLYKSGFPARYGSRLSSVMDIWTRDGNKQSFGGDITVGLLSAKATIEGPIVKGKSSFLISARRTFWDQWLKLGSERIYDLRDGIGNLGYFFFDFNAKVNFQLSEKSSIYFSFYNGKDDFENMSIFRSIEGDPIFEDFTDRRWDWGNGMGVIRLSQQLGKRSYLKAAAFRTNYDFETYEFKRVEEIQDSLPINKTFEAGLYSSKIADQGVSIDFDFLPNPKNTLKFGGKYTHHSYTPGIRVEREIGNLIEENPEFGIEVMRDRLNAPEVTGSEIQFYIENNYKPNEHNTLNFGIHQAIINTNNQSFFLPQPRLSYLFHKKGFSLKTSVSFLSQYLHLITNSGLGLPIDVWLPSTDIIKPQRGWIASFGIEKDTEKGYHFGAEAYYKNMTNVLSFAEGNLLNITDDDTSWQERIPVGIGWAYGLESFFNKTAGNANWNMNYTLGWSYREFEAINNGEPFRHRFDRRHNFKFAYLHKINENAEFTLNFQYASGNPITLPTGVHEVPLENGNTTDLLIYKEKNNKVLPDYHRLDVGFNFYSKYKWGRQKFSLGIFNIYSQLNPSFIEVRKISSNPSKFLFESISLLPVLPSLSYSISF